MDYIYLGKIVNTHGIKGEVRILSNFDKKELVFRKGFNIYIGANYQKEVIDTYRVHKNYDMITMVGINDINDVLKYKGAKVYIKREDLNLDNNDYLLQDLIGLKVIANNTCYGNVKTPRRYRERNRLPQFLHLAERGLRRRLARRQTKAMV